MIFVDTSVWYAAADRRDQLNERAKETLSLDEALVTSDHVVIETCSLLHNRGHPDVAERFLHSILHGTAALEMTTLADMRSAVEIAEHFPGHDFSLVDRTSFAVMQRLGIHRAASFDSDFAVYRYGRDRHSAFTVVP